MNLPTAVSQDTWLTARKALLAKEKEFSAARDALSAARRELPMVQVDKDYVFDGPNGKATLLDLFEGRPQLIVYHFMWRFDLGKGCPSCSLLVDNMGHLAHLHARRTSLAIITRGPLAESLAFRDRMGWTFPWYSSAESDFNYDFHVTLDPAKGAVEYNYRPDDSGWSGEGPGVSVFVRDGDRVFHTYSTYARGGDILLNTYNYLDLTPYGRQETFEKSPEGRPQEPFMSWVRHHDDYGKA
ncbi:DUF899 domain-containing protein [Actinocrispum wychmicini]|uniref:Putative dithiol-disulfide oxidoreductase (DUF899 family) n=1 Tax=Actinocrispum wychmicini TaxID=1213861 RepID=A0A4R2K4H6_9PSEU|nr:DUF899 domain-containing protein [Actinocrispum wychmicini]TCO64709.1 putative dithiol-disulfide oxidoreductase (DUF899 family) [Actinocrispum wychmicini]